MHKRSNHIMRVCVCVCVNARQLQVSTRGVQLPVDAPDSNVLAQHAINMQHARGNTWW